MSNYPDGMTMRDWDHVEGPLREEELTRTCTRELFRSPTPKECGGQLTRLYWRGGVVDTHCEDCGIVEQEG